MAVNGVDAEDIAGQASFVELNANVLVRYWDGAIEFTEDMMDAMRPLPEANGT